MNDRTETDTRRFPSRSSPERRKGLASDAAVEAEPCSAQARRGTAPKPPSSSNTYELSTFM